MSNLTQPICYDCWQVRNPGRDPVTVNHGGDKDTCCDCGRKSVDGIYIRVDPKTVKFPRKEPR